MAFESDVTSKDAKARAIQEHIISNLGSIIHSRNKKFQNKLELFIGKTPTHLEELEFKVNELKSKLITLLTCLESRSRN